MDMTFTLFLEAMLGTMLLMWLWSWLLPSRRARMVDKFPGPPLLPVLGNVHQVGTNANDVFCSFELMAKKYYGGPFRLWLGNAPFVMLSRPNDLEIVMGSNKLIDKASSYKVTQPWLGTGLLTSTGSKWRRSRKILTPAFHFKILSQFVEVFFSNGEILIDCLREKVGSQPFDIHQYITLYTLDNICETAMGLKINAMKDTESIYANAVKRQSACCVSRALKPWLLNEWIFSLSSLKAQQDKELKILHGTTESVIQSRLEMIMRERAAKQSGNGSTQVSEDGTKRRLAFLDLLIESMLDGSELTAENIREEVDTVMFAGHDTTAAAITFSLWLLSWHQDIQDAVVQEVLESWPDSTETLTFQTVQEFKLLERVIRETLRLYPSVPLYGRELSEDVEFSGGLVAPKGTSIVFMTYVAHKDPEFFPDPEKFDPDRFLPENVQSRHPYAYTPFSAGPRNCIGQKFAMLEMKCTLAQVLREYRFLPGAETQYLKITPELVIVAKDGVPVKIQAR